MMPLQTAIASQIAGKAPGGIGVAVLTPGGLRHRAGSVRGADGALGHKAAEPADV